MEFLETNLQILFYDKSLLIIRKSNSNYYLISKFAIPWISRVYYVKLCEYLLSTWDDARSFPDAVVDIITEEDASVDTEGRRETMSAEFYD